MARIISIDYGLRRVGVAVSDPTQTISSPLATVPNNEIFRYLEQYFIQHQVDTIVLGLPLDLKGNHNEMTAEVDKFKNQLGAKFPDVKIALIDERLTSVMAKQSLLSSGMKKKNRSNKSNVDMVSASLILQSYLNRKSRPNMGL